MMRVTVRAVAFFLVVGTFCVPAWTAGAGEEGMFRLREPGEPLPEITLRDLEGRDHSLRFDRPDRPVLLFFWSVYCPNCKDAMPKLVELQQGALGDEVSVWAVNVDGERFSNAVRVYVEDMELPFPVVYDRLEGEFLVAADPLGVRKTPTLYLADADGTILLRQVIRMDWEAVSEALAARNAP